MKPYNKRMESARTARPTRYGEAPSLAAHSRRWATEMNRKLVLLAFAFFCSQPYSVQTSAAEISAEDILPKWDEPDYEDVEYAATPKDIRFVATPTSNEVIKAFWRKYSGRFSIDEMKIRLRGEHAIIHRGSYFKRMEFFLEDRRELSEHGYCGQYFAAWLTRGGAIHGFYFSERVCPV